MQRIVTTRPVIMGKDGMITTPHYLASLAGAKILLSGGNAIDATIAASAVLTVVYPHNTTIGGDAFAIVYDGNKGKLKGVNASGRSSYGANLSFFNDKGLERIPLTGMLPVTVPGLVDGWCKMIEIYGTMQLTEVFQYAINYAKNGFPVSQKLSDHIRDRSDVLAFSPDAKELFLNEGRAPEPGEILVQKNLAKTLQLIAEGGRDAFYNGPIARSIVDFSGKNGGLLSEEDFSDHKTDLVDPVSTNYRGNEVYAFPPNSQGITTLISLNMLQEFDVSSLGHASAKLIELMVESKKIAFNDRDNYITDPMMPGHDISVEYLLSKEHTDENRHELKRTITAASNQETLTAARQSDSLSGLKNGGDTCYLCAVDKFGNAVSFIQSIYFSFGSAMVAGNTGILLQNRGAYFSLDPSHPNHIEPHKRTLHTLSPAMMFRDDLPVMVFGTMGGDGQPQTQLQLITDIVDFGMNVQEAIEFPRWLHGRSMIGDRTDALNLEEGFDTKTVSDLEKMGHIVTSRRRWDEIFGHAQAIMIDSKTGVLNGGADPRGDGIAIGF